MQDSFLKPLKSIQKVEVSPYLLTRIHQRIKNMEVEQVPTKIMWVVGFSYLFLICVNWAVLSKSQVPQNGPVSEWVQDLDLQSSNSLY